MSKFTIRYGWPIVNEIVSSLRKKYKDNTISKDDRKLLKKYVKCFKHLSEDPHHPGLGSHEISTLTAKYKVKIFESYLENKTPAAGRIFWRYGPVKGEITICGIEPHPKNSAYNRVSLELDPKDSSE